MAWIEGCDYAYSHPDPDGMFAADLRFVLRYFSHTLGKGLTAAERDALWAAGLAIRGLYESTATRALGGYASGRADAEQARQIARSLGYPDSLPIIFAVDFQATATQLAGPVSAYFGGIASVESGDEAYGGIATINALIKNHLSAGGFQTYAWSSGQWSPAAEIEQYHNGATIAGGVVDRCRALSTVKFWQPGGSVGDGEVDMTQMDLTPAAVEAVRAAVLGSRVDNLAPPADGDPVSLGQAARMSYYRDGYVANTFAPAVLAAETNEAAALELLHAELASLPAGVVAALPPPGEGGTFTLADVQAAAAQAVTAVMNRTTAALSVAPAPQP